ncbi:hypothetical protein HAX54_037343 [Datura stramonium]|uniref:Uncharacterized protein n=1 Tax=Datura stramonium TaxID=4076 RepID=A0ABS8RMI2_DATST|nr:hypothetical protein [Datura stramonium]
MLTKEKEKTNQNRRGLVDEVEPSQTEENINLTAPQQTVNSQSSIFSDFEHDEDPCLKPAVISETLVRLQRRQQQHIPTGRRVISFKGDHNGFGIVVCSFYAANSVFVHKFIVLVLQCAVFFAAVCRFCAEIAVLVL